MTALRANPFSPLIDPASVLAACANSASLSTLPTHAHHRADLPSVKVSKDLAEFDAAIDAVANSSPGPAAVKPSGKRIRPSGRSEQQTDVAKVAAEPALNLVVPTSTELEMLTTATLEACAAPEMEVVAEEGAKEYWWTVPIACYLVGHAKGRQPA